MPSRQSMLSRIDDHIRLLTKKAKQFPGTYPVRFNHCFLRIAYDNTMGCKWDTVVAKPARDNMTVDQLLKVNDLLWMMLNFPQETGRLNEKSLEYRGKA